MALLKNMASSVDGLVFVFHRLVYFLFFIGCITHQSHALFEDQVGKFDWKQEFIGKVDKVYLPTGNRRIVVATTRHVLASLHPRNGNLAWRQVYENNDLGHIDALSGVDDSVLTVFGGGKIVRSWDSTSGLLNWEAAIAPSNNENIIDSFHQLIPKTEELLVVEITADRRIHVASINFTTGTKNWSFTLAVPWHEQYESCEFVAERLFVCVDHFRKTLYSLLANDDQKWILTPINVLVGGNETLKHIDIISLPGATSRRQLFLITVSENHQKLIGYNSGRFSVLQDLPDVMIADVIEADGGMLLFTVSTRDGTVVLGAQKLDTGEEIPGLSVDLDLSRNHGAVTQMWLYSVPKKEGGSAYRALLLFQDHAFTLVQVPGKSVWLREEALASVLTVEMVDLPVSESDAKFEQEFRAGDANLISMFFKRLTTQLLQLESFLMSVIGGLNPTELSTISRSPIRLTRDAFNLHKVLILVTSPGKIFGMDSETGLVIWSYLVPLMVPFARFGTEHLLLFTQRSTAHFPRHPQCIVIGKNKVTGHGVLHVFDPINGRVLDGGTKQLNFQIAQATLLPQPDDSYLRGVLLLDTDNKVHLYPSSTVEVAKLFAKTLYLFTAEVDKGLMTGYNLAHAFENNMKVFPTWKLNLPRSSQVISDVVMKRPSEHVHSQGRVMGDRSVMYKYLNPNLAAVLTEGTDSQQKAFFNIFLVDVVTGSIVFSAIHRRCHGPVHLVHSENWIVYMYFNDKARRTEVAVLELYEGKSQSNTTAFSSLNPPQPPMVERQAYIFPPGLDAMAVTLTEKGITSKHLLFALPSGGILELPKALLDPRRPLVPTQEHREEGIFPYIPELPVPSENIINYNKSIFHVRNIYTAPAGLESTCLVLAYGVDLFFTRVTPSRTFDVLKDDFDHYLISAVLLGLILASYATRRLSARKALHQAWK